MTEIRNLQNLAEYAQRQMRRSGQLRSGPAVRAGRGESRRGYVRARTGAGGRLEDLRIDPAARRLTVEQLEAEVVDAVTAAQRQYAERADDGAAAQRQRAERAGHPGAPAPAIRPSAQALAQLEDGMAKLDSLAAGLSRITRQRRPAR